MKEQPSPTTTRRGFSALEFQVAMILLGIALAGMVPLVVMQAKQLDVMENRWDPSDSDYDPTTDYWLDPYRCCDDGPVYYLVPPEVSDCSLANPWARKLGAPALIVAKAASETPPARPIDGTAGTNAVTIDRDSPDKVVTIDNETAGATVTVDPPDE